MNLSYALEDWSVPMAEARAIVRESIERRFATETDPEGNPWPELNDGYLFRKLRGGYPADKLKREGYLYDAATDEGAMMITEREILFEPSEIPFYGEYHQTGLPERQNPLPQRMFIGLDEQAIDEIESYFVYWINRTVQTDYPSDVGEWRRFMTGDIAVTTSGLTGMFTGISSFGGGTLIRGNRGKFIGRTFETGSFF
jgi:phage gpG-like protein